MKNFENDFGRWLQQQEGFTKFTSPKDNYDWLQQIPFSMQWGVYVDFFDENGIYISTNFESYDDTDGWPPIMVKNYFSWVNEELLIPYNTRQEARKAALEKAIQIYNSLDQ